MPVLPHLNLLILSRSCECFSGCFHIQRLMGASVVVEPDPITDGACRMLDVVEALAVDALLLQGSDHALDHAVLLRAIRRDELLLQAVATCQCGIVPRGEDQSIFAKVDTGFAEKCVYSKGWSGNSMRTNRISLQSVVGPQAEELRHPAERAEPADQGVFKCARSKCDLLESHFASNILNDRIF